MCALQFKIIGYCREFTSQICRVYVIIKYFDNFFKQ